MRAVVFDPHVGDMVSVVALAGHSVGGEQSGNIVSTDLPIGTMLEVVQDGIDSDEEVNVMILDGTLWTTYIHFSLLTPAVAADTTFTPEGVAEFLGES